MATTADEKIEELQVKYAALEGSLSEAFQKLQDAQVNKHNK